MGRRPEPFPPRPHRHDRGNRACVCWRRRHYHLGTWTVPPGRGSDGVLDPAAKLRFGTLLSLWAADPNAVPDRGDVLLVADLCADYLDSARAPTEKRAKARVKTAVLLLRDAYGDIAVDEFGPNKLRAWQGQLATLEDEPGHRRFNRTTVVQLVAVVRRIWKWGVSTERIERALYDTLLTVEGPRPGECRESAPRAAADPDAVRATLPFLRPPARAVIQLMMLTGSRPGELCRLTPAELHVSGKIDLPGAGVVDLNRAGVWVYAPAKHKTARLGKWKWIVFGHQAKAILAPFLDRHPLDYCFSPRESIADLRKSQRAARLARGGGSGGNRKPAASKPRRAFRSYYTPDTLRQAVANAVAKANRVRAAKGEPEIPAWFPYSCRHLAAATIDSSMGIDAVEAALGHSDPSTSKRYAKRSWARAVEVATAMG